MSEKARQNTLASVTNCGVCGQPLVYATESVPCICTLCGKDERALIYCPAGHYVCDSCHSKAALDILRQVLSTTKTTDPAAILEQVMSHHSVPMHGPEHHAMVPGANVAAVRNTGYAALPEGAVEKALERAIKVLGGWCGLNGDCGAAVGLGIAVSVITGATPLTGKQRTLALAATSFALSHMLDDQPRCCKRASRVAIESATEFLRDRLGITLLQHSKAKCIYSLQNQQCAQKSCPFYDDI